MEEKIFTKNYTNTGNTVTVARDYNFANLLSDDFDAILMPHVHDLDPVNITDLDNWFDSGDKLLWISGNSDYGGYWLANQTHAMMEGLGTVLRFDAGGVDDSVMFTAVGTGATGYAISTRYFVVEVPDDDTFTLSATLGGSAIAGTGDSSGTWTLAQLTAQDVVDAIEALLTL